MCLRVSLILFVDGNEELKNVTDSSFNATISLYDSPAVGPSMFSCIVYRVFFFTRRVVSNIAGYISCPFSEHTTVFIDLNTSEDFRIVRLISCFPVDIVVSVFRFAVSYYPFVISRLFFVNKGQNSVSIIGNSTPNLTLPSPPPPRAFCLPCSYLTTATKKNITRVKRSNFDYIEIQPVLQKIA